MDQAEAVIARYIIAESTILFLEDVPYLIPEVDRDLLPDVKHRNTVIDLSDSD